MTMIQVGTRTYVRLADIESVSSLTELSDLSKVRTARKEGRAVVLTGKTNCTAVFLTDGKVILTSASAKLIRDRIQAADMTSVLFY